MDGAPGAGTPELEVRLLGPIEVDRDGGPLPLGGQKPRALLAVLALEPGRVVSVDRLIESLWPGDPPQTAAHAVQVYVSQLRKALGPVIASRAPGYALEIDPEHVDLHRFSRLAVEGGAALASGDAAAAEVALREALALWRGPALADFLYEPFTQTEIARLEELRTAVLEERVQADLALGRHAELVSELEALVQKQPLRERPRAQLMLALYRSGRQADALAAYRDARQTLVGELGIEPGSELRELEAAILRQDESLLLEDAAPASPAMQFRRLATILVVDVVDSMAVADALDPEALGGVQRRFFETVDAALRRHGGTAVTYAGDAVTAVFGIPVSHEDDALRAARAAVDIHVGIAALSEALTREHGLALAARIGLAAGEVVASSTESRQRIVGGGAVGVAARLQHAASPGETVVGEVVARLIDHAARLEPLGTLEVKSRKAPIEMYRLVELEAAAPAFERRLDAPLVGRRRELAALRRSLKRAVDDGSARVALVVAPPGVGKSRLMAELARRTKSVTWLWGRCLSYGDGITYWPLREALAETAEGDERAAVIAALDSETPPPAPEIAWLFRRFCEAQAREKPLVVVFDDVHWAEPTFLELVEHLADKGEAPILVVCVAREELGEEQPGFLAGRSNVDRIELEPLSVDDTEALLDGLGGAVLESDQRTRIAETAEGNPLFLEQLVALALEGGLVETSLPETIQALLVARLDRLGPGERAVLERGAVIGKEFRLEDVAALVEPAAAATTEVHMSSLAARGFVRPSRPGEFRFRHVLVQEAVYRAAPKRLRAELHERFADRLDETSRDLAELDEFVGYHLERAYLLRTELGESDRRVARLAGDGGRRLGAAGLRALKRGDLPASTNRLIRATSLLDSSEPLQRELLAELGMCLRATGDSNGAERALDDAIRSSIAAGDRRTEQKARIEQQYLHLLSRPGTTADAILQAIADGVPIFESVGDERSLGRAWLLAGFVEGGHLGHHEAWEEAGKRALEHYMRARWPISACLGEIGAAFYYGPTPVTEAIVQSERFLRDETMDRSGRANVLCFLGGLVAQQGDFDDARNMLASARATYDELGRRELAATYCLAVLGDVELLARAPEAAERVLRELCEELERMHDFSHLASRASDLAEALYVQDRLIEADEWTAVALSHASADDLDAQVFWRSVRAKIRARSGELDAAEDLARSAAGLVEESDGLNRRARVQCDLGEVLRLAGRRAEAESSFERAVALYEQKGNVVGAERVRSLRDLAVA